MQLGSSKLFSTLALALPALLIGLIFTHAPGTTDVEIWRAWTNNAITRGLVQGYAANQADYPPLAVAILFVANRLLNRLDLSTFLSIKLAILVFLLLSTLLFWLWTRDFKATLILYFGLLLNSVALGYIDIFFAPGLIISLWMLQRRRWGWFSLFFALTCLTKWQPLIIAPFITLYCLGAQDARGLKQVRWKQVLPELLLPAGSLALLAALIFGGQPLWLALRASLSHPYLSGNALNLNWIITHFLHVYRPNEFGGLQNGLAGYVLTADPAITTFPRLLFLGTYLLSLAVFFRREKSFENLLAFAIAGFLSYYTFNTGVHENHLFLVTILAAALLWVKSARQGPAIGLILMSNINMFLFYGVDGTLHFPRLFLGVDLALPLAAFNVLFCGYYYAAVVTEVPQAPAEEQSSQPHSLSRNRLW